MWEKRHYSETFEANMPMKLEGENEGIFFKKDWNYIIFCGTERGVLLRPSPLQGQVF